MDILLDTHAWVWTLTDDTRLSHSARTAIAGANAVRVSPISFFEIGQKVRSGKWPEMVPHLCSLPDRLAEQGGLTAPLSNEAALLAAGMEWRHGDPFDRSIAATAMLTGATLISADTMFDTLPDPRLRRLW